MRVVDKISRAGHMRPSHGKAKTQVAAIILQPLMHKYLLCPPDHRFLPKCCFMRGFFVIFLVGPHRPAPVVVRQHELLCCAVCWLMLRSAVLYAGFRRATFRRRPPSCPASCCLPGLPTSPCRSSAPKSLLSFGSPLWAN